jgi:hypothetical protein
VRLPSVVEAFCLVDDEWPNARYRRRVKPPQESVRVPVVSTRDFLLRRPSAYVPLTMSFAALGVVAVHIAFVGTAPEADEGAAAHLWQLLMAGQLPVIAIFALKSLPSTPRQATLVLSLQLLAGIAAALPVFLLRF